MRFSPSLPTKPLFACLFSAAATIGTVTALQAKEPTGDTGVNQQSAATMPTALPFTYETFEAAVAHIDLENCPEALPQQESFCRAAIHNEEIHVFAFSLDGDSPMIGFASFSAEGLEPLLK